MQKRLAELRLLVLAAIDDAFLEADMCERDYAVKDDVLEAVRGVFDAK
jgi:hypothetical protein